jgi:hypothetical protein
VLIRETGTELDISGTPAELRSVAEQLAVVVTGEGEHLA